MRIRLWGTRGSIPSPGPETIIFGGNTTCVEIVLSSGHLIVIDAGTGIRALGDHLIASGQPVHMTLLLSHTHWDHVLGMPFFKPVYREDTIIDVDGCPRAFYGLATIFDNHKGNGFFPVAFNDLKAQINFLDRLPRGPLQIGSGTIEGIELYHPQGGMGFRIREGRHSLAFFTDNELSPLAPLGRQEADYATFIHGSDLLIHDAQYTPAEIDNHRGWGHSTYIEAVDLALRGKVKQLLLFHHDPARTDSQIIEIEEKARQLAHKHNRALIVSAAREGMSIDLINS